MRGGPWKSRRPLDPLGSQRLRDGKTEPPDFVRGVVCNTWVVTARGAYPRSVWTVYHAARLHLNQIRPAEAFAPLLVGNDPDQHAAFHQRPDVVKHRGRGEVGAGRHVHHPEVVQRGDAGSKAKTARRTSTIPDGGAVTAWGT